MLYSMLRAAFFSVFVCAVVVDPGQVNRYWSSNVWFYLLPAYMLRLYKLNSWTALWISCPS